LQGVVALLYLHGDFREHLGAGVFADVVQILAIIGRLQTDESCFALRKKFLPENLPG